MTELVFVDTNVLLYRWDRRDAIKQRRALEWLTHLWQERTGRTSIQVLSEFYFNVTRKLRPGLPASDAWNEVQAYLAWDPQPVDAAVLDLAGKLEQRYRLSWWDSLVAAAANLQGCDLLLTEDMQDGLRLGNVVVRDPFAVRANDATAAFEVVARPAHRSRGRPRTKPLPA